MEFWGVVANDGILKEPNVIVGGYLNFTVFAREVWGLNVRLDPLASFLSNLFQNVGLVDVEPGAWKPTWRNGTLGVKSISKRLYRFYIFEELVSSVHKFRSWIVPSTFSDH